jgi:flavin-dependent dehydrogenase
MAEFEVVVLGGGPAGTHAALAAASAGLASRSSTRTRGRTQKLLARLPLA